METHPSHHQPRRRRRNRTTSSVVATVATSAAVAYGAYRLSKWYWDEKNKHDDDREEETTNEQGHSEELRPLEEDLLQQSTGINGLSSVPPAQPHASDVSSSWLSTATEWIVDTAVSTLSSTTTFPTQNVAGSHHPRPPPPGCRSAPITGRTRRQRLVHCRQKTVTAFCACLPALQLILEELTSTSRATRELKELRKQQKDLVVAGKEGDKEDTSDTRMKRLQQQQDDLWKHIVVENTTRMMAASYAYTLLLLSLTVQLHWISGNRDSLLRDSVGAPISSTDLAQAMLMQSHQYLQEDGIPLLVATIRRSVEAIVGGESTDIEWTKPTQLLVDRDIEQLLYNQLPQMLKYGAPSSSDSSVAIRPSIHRNWMRFVFPDEECFDPIWDIGSSPVWEDAQEQILQTLWYKLLRDADVDGWKRLFEQTSEAEQEAAMSFHHKPVAKVVAQFKRSSNLLFAEELHTEVSTTQGGLHQKGPGMLSLLQKLPTVLELGDVSFQQH